MSTDSQVKSGHAQVYDPQSAIPVRDPGLQLLKWFEPHETIPKRHLDRFSRFSTAHARGQQTDTQTNYATTVTIGRIFCCAWRCGLVKIIVVLIFRNHWHAGSGVYTKQ